ncbi:MAG: DNA-binding protein [Lachnospiraceae bacterium]|nr:DNA-binding protein [Lachnospiraceae bacterium]
MEKLIERGLLYDFYGELLTKHQQDIYSEIVFNDLSLGELSEAEGISRQGIHDLIKRCDKQLEGYEDKLKLIEKFNLIKTQVSNLNAYIDSQEGIDPLFKERLLSGLNNIVKEL